MLDDLKVRIKIFSLHAFHMLLIMIVGVTGVIGMARIKGEFKASNETHTLALVRLAGVLDDIHQIQAIVVKASHETAGPRELLATERLAQLEAERTHLWLDYVSSRISAEEEAIVWRVERSWKSFVSAIRPDRTAPIQVASLQAVPVPSPVVRLDDASSSLDSVRDAVRQLIAIQGRAAESSYAVANGLFMKLGIFSLVLVCVGLGLAGLIMFWDFVRLREGDAKA